MISNPRTRVWFVSPAECEAIGENAAFAGYYFNREGRPGIGPCPSRATAERAAALDTADT